LITHSYQITHKNLTSRLNYFHTMREISGVDILFFLIGVYLTFGRMTVTNNCFLGF